MTNKYFLLEGTAQIANYFGISTGILTYMLTNNLVPGVNRVERRLGGRPMWIMPFDVAYAIQTKRQNTPQYSPHAVAQKLHEQFPGYKSIADMVKFGKLTTVQWCDTLAKARRMSHMDDPIYMNVRDLRQWYYAQLHRQRTQPSETQEIFREVRNGSGKSKARRHRLGAASRKSRKPRPHNPARN